MKKSSDRSVLAATRVRERSSATRVMAEALESRVMLSNGPWLTVIPPQHPAAVMAWHAGLPPELVDQDFSYQFGSQLGLDGTFAYSTQRARYESTGPVEIGVRGAAGFTPLLDVTGSVWYDQSRVLHVAGSVDRLWNDSNGAHSGHLFNGSFALGFDSTSVSGLTETDAGASFAGAMFQAASLDFSGSQLLLGGALTLPSSVGGASILMGPDSVALAADGAATFSTPATPGLELVLGGERFDASGSVTLNWRSVAGEMRVGGRFTLPQWGNAGSIAVVLDTSSGPYVSLTGSGAADLVGTILLPSVVIAGPWSFSQVSLSIDPVAGGLVTTGLVTLSNGGSAVITSGFTVSGGVTTINGLSGVGIDTHFAGLGLDIRNWTFVSDQDTGDALSWDPRIAFSGTLAPPAAMIGVIAAGGPLAFQVDSSNPLVVTSQGYSMANPHLTAAGPWTVAQFRVGAFEVDSAVLTGATLDVYVGHGFGAAGTPDAAWASFQTTVTMTTVDNVRVGLSDQVNTVLGVVAGGHFVVNDNGFGYQGVMPLMDPLNIDAAGLWRVEGLVFSPLSGPNTVPEQVTVVPGEGSPFQLAASVVSNHFISITYDAGQGPGVSFTFGGMTLTLSHLGFVSDRDLTDNGGRPNLDPQLELAGVLTLAGAVSGNFILAVPPTDPNLQLAFTIPNVAGQRLIVNRVQGVFLQTANFSINGSWQVKFFGAVVVIVTNPSLTYQASGGGPSFRFTGAFTFPQLNNLTLSFAGPGDYIRIFNDGTGPAAELVGSLSYPNAINIDPAGKWNVSNLLFTFDTVEDEYTGTATLQAGSVGQNIAMTAFYQARAGSNGQLGLFGLTQVNPPALFKFYGMRASMTFFEFLSDRNPNDQQDWDPQVKLAGSMAFPRQLTGGVDVSFAIPNAQPLTINGDGVSLAGVFTFGAVDISIFGITNVNLSNNRITFDTVQEFVQFETRATFQVFNGTVADFSGQDAQGRSRYIRIDSTGVSVAGSLSIPGPLVVFSPWAIQNIVFSIFPPQVDGNGNIVPGTGQFAGSGEIVTPGTVYAAQVLITPNNFSLTVANNQNVIAFSVAGVGFKVTSIGFVANRNNVVPFEWDPQLRVAGSIVLPPLQGNLTASTDSLTVDADGVHIDNATFALPGNQTFNIFNVLEVTTQNVSLTISTVTNEATLTGVFRVPSLNGLTIDLNAQNGRYFKAKYDDQTGTFDYATNALASVAAVPVFGGYSLQNVTLQLTRNYGGTDTTINGAARLLTPGDPIDFALSVVNFRVARVDVTFPSPKSFTVFGITASVGSITFIPDRNPNDNVEFDPEFQFTGGLNLGPRMGSIGVQVNDPNRLVVNSSGVSLTGAAIQLPNVNFNFMNLIAVNATNMAITYVGGADPFLKIQGRVQFPTLYNVTADFADPNYVKISSAGVVFVGTISVQNITLPGGAFSIPSASLSFDLVSNPNKVTAAASIKIPPKGVVISGTIMFLNGVPNFISVSIDNLNIPLVPPYPIYLQRLMGSVNNIAPNTPPVEIGAGIGLTIGPQISITLPGWLGGGFSGSLLRVDVNGTISSQRMTANGTLTVIGGLMTGSGSAILDWTANPGYFRANGSLSMLGGFVTYTGALNFDFNANFSANVGAQVRVPNGIAQIAPYGTGWIADAIAGASLGSAQARIAFTNNNNSSDDYVLGYGQYDLGWAGTYTVGLQVWFNGSTKFITSESEIPGGNSFTGGDETFNVAPGTPRLSIHTDWDNPDPNTPFELIDPHGHVHTYSNFDDVNVGLIDSFTTDTSFTVAALNPLPGTWTIRMLNAAALGTVNFRATGTVPPPQLAVTSPALDTSAPVVPIDYTLGNIGADPDAQVTFEYDTDRSGFDGQVIQSIAATDGSHVYNWDTSTVAPGSYYVYAVVVTTGGVVSQYAVGRVTIADPAAPAQVTGLTAAFAGANQMHLTWDAVPNADHYVVQYTADAAGDTYTDLLNFYEGTDMTVSGLTPGETYRFSVEAVDSDGHVGASSDPVIGIVGDTPTVPPGPGEWDVFANPGTTYALTLNLDPADTLTLVAGPGSVASGTHDYSWDVPGAQSGWSTIVLLDTHADGSVDVIRRQLLSDATPFALYGGQVFDDVDGSGTRTNTEQGLNGFTVDLLDPVTNAVLRQVVTQDIDLNNDSVIDPTTESGLYRFTGVAPGRYLLAVESQGRIINAPVSVQYDRTLLRGESDLTLDFALGGSPIRGGGGDGTHGGVIVSLPRLEDGPLASVSVIHSLLNDDGGVWPSLEFSGASGLMAIANGPR